MTTNQPTIPLSLLVGFSSLSIASLLSRFNSSSINDKTRWKKKKKFVKMSTESLKKDSPRLRDTASWLPLAAGASSRNLGHAFLRTLHRQRDDSSKRF